MRTMRTTITRAVLALTSAGVLSLAGCAGADEQDDTTTAEATTTQTVQSETSADTDQSASAGQTTQQPTGGASQDEEATITEGAPSESQPPPSNPAESPAPTQNPDEELPQEPVGSPVTIAGQPATVCIYGDGWGTNVWAGNANTSCEFVSATHETLIEGLNPTTQNIRDHLQPEISVTSPVTGETYDLSCAPRGEQLVSCTGGEGAEVFFY